MQTRPQISVDRFSRGDRRLAAVCLAVIAVGTAIGATLFSRAFPEASIDFRVTREEARRVAERGLAARGFDVAGRTALGVFDHDDEAKVFLERELGLAKAVPLLGREVPVWRWSFRFVRPLAKGELRAFVSPEGELLSFRRILPEKDAAPDAGPGRARALAEETLRAHRGLDPAALKFVEATEERRPARVDRTFVWESTTLRWNGAALRYLVEVQGDRVGRSSLWLEVPEAWRQAYATLRSKNRAAGAVATFGLALTALALVVVFFDRLRRRDVKWRWALAFAMTGTALQMAASLNELPITLFSYETTEGWGSFVTQALLSDFGAACLLGLVLLLLVAGGEPEYREAYPDKPALGRVFSRRAFGTKRVFLGLLAGYALTAGFFAYQVLFYLAADRLGAWSPADVPYSNLLGTSFPWLGVLLMGFVPATTEEFSSRMFSIPFLRRFAPGWVAVGVPALIWGFAHSAYPNQPFWIRGAEVGLAGVVIGLVMLELDLFPLLVWHFTVDAVYTSLILVRSTNTYFAVSGALAAGVLLLPLVVAGVLALKRGGFEAERGLTNGEVGSAPPPWPGASSEAPAVVRPRALSMKHVVVAALVSVAALLVAGGPATGWPGRRPARLPHGRDRGGAGLREAAGGRPGALPGGGGERLGAAVAGGRGRDGGRADSLRLGAQRRALAARARRDAGARKWATTVLPGPVWQVRLARERDRHRWWVVVDARDGRVTGFSRGFPEEEAGASLSPAEALETAKAAARARGIDAAALVVVSSNAEERKARRDHRIVFEVPSQAAGEARRRVTVSVAGAKPSLVATALKLPEEWARAQGRSTTATYTALGLKVAGFGTVIGLGLMALLRAHRAGKMRWRQAALWAALLTLPALLERVSNVPTLLRTWSADMPLSVYAVTAAIGVAVGLLLSYALALVAVGLVTAVAPHALGLLRRPLPGGGTRALRGAAATALLVFAARGLKSSLGAAFPAEAGTWGFAFPPGIDGWLPATTVLASATELALLVAGGAALATLLFRDLAPTRGRLFLGLAAFGCWAPLDARTFGDVVVPLVSGALPAAALAVGVAFFLKDDPWAYVFTAVGVVVLRGGAALVTSGVTPWIASGGVCLAVGLLVLLAPGWRTEGPAIPPTPARAE
ncbi:MAG: CPBP family intramembrane metalloprotease [Holophagales bacterium]|nr:CPBP family intramembrane metalloprotease [Holophagales bacterium]